MVYHSILEFKDMPFQDYNYVYRIYIKISEFMIWWQILYKFHKKVAKNTKLSIVINFLFPFVEFNDYSINSQSIARWSPSRGNRRYYDNQIKGMEGRFDGEGLLALPFVSKIAS